MTQGFYYIIIKEKLVVTSKDPSFRITPPNWFDTLTPLKTVKKFTTPSNFPSLRLLSCSQLIFCVLCSSKFVLCISGAGHRHSAIQTAMVRPASTHSHSSALPHTTEHPRVWLVAWRSPACVAPASQARHMQRVLIGYLFVQKKDT